jgi:hypothetical protein
MEQKKFPRLTNPNIFSPADPKHKNFLVWPNEHLNHVAFL